MSVPRMLGLLRHLFPGCWEQVGTSITMFVHASKEQVIGAVTKALGTLCCFLTTAIEHSYGFCPA